MQYLNRAIGVLAFVAILSPLSAQTSTELRALLQRMNTEQKKMVLEYIRSLKEDTDQEILCAFEQLSTTAKSRALKYVQAVQPNTGDNRPARTMVSWNRDTLSLGKIEEGTIVLDSFIVSNTGQAPYLITNHKSSCDCTVLSAPKIPVLPGEKATVRIEFNSTGKRGSVSTGIVLQDNSSPNARSILYIRAEVSPRRSSSDKKPWEN